MNTLINLFTLLSLLSFGLAAYFYYDNYINVNKRMDWNKWEKKVNKHIVNVGYCKYKDKTPDKLRDEIINNK